MLTHVLSTGSQQLGLLPSAQQLQAATINQASVDPVLPQQSLPSHRNMATTHYSLSSIQVAQSTAAPTHPVALTASRGSHTALESWLYGDTPSVSANNTSPTEPISSLVSIGSTLPQLSKKTLQQITSGEFVDFSDSPPARSRPRDISQVLTLALLQLQDKKNRLHHLVTVFCYIHGSPWQ